MNTEQLRELDAWIAEHVMGWKSVHDIHGEIMGYPPNSVDGFDFEHLPRYTTDRAAAMEVLERCCDRATERIQVTKFRHWIFGVSFGIGGILAHAETLPLAICLFAKELFSK